MLLTFWFTARAKLNVAEKFKSEQMYLHSIWFADIGWKNDMNVLVLVLVLVSGLGLEFFPSLGLGLGLHHQGLDYITTIHQWKLYQHATKSMLLTFWYTARTKLNVAEKFN